MPPKQLKRKHDENFEKNTKKVNSFLIFLTALVTATIKKLLQTCCKMLCFTEKIYKLIQGHIIDDINWVVGFRRGYIWAKVQMGKGIGSLYIP